MTNTSNAATYHDQVDRGVALGFARAESNGTDEFHEVTTSLQANGIPFKAGQVPVVLNDGSTVKAWAVKIENYSTIVIDVDVDPGSVRDVLWTSDDVWPAPVRSRLAEIAFDAMFGALYAMFRAAHAPSDRELLVHEAGDVREDLARIAERVFRCDPGTVAV